MPALAVNPDEGLWQRNAILNGRNTLYRHYEIEGTLSIKAIVRGRGEWSTPDGRYPIDESVYLVLNHGRLYNIEIVSDEPVETFCAFFRPGFVAGVEQALTTHPLSDTPQSERGFYERLEPAGPVRAELLRLHARLEEGPVEKWEAEEWFLRLAEHLLKQQEGARMQALRLDLMQASAREEIFNCLNRARDFILSSFSQRLSLSSVAHEAALSPFHFHRLFKKAYRQTPHEFLTALRLSRAKKLLRETEMPLAEICWAVGFESVGTFANLFKRSEAMTPGAYRRGMAEPSKD